VEPAGVELSLGHAVHEVLVPELVRRALQQKLGQNVTLHTLEFLEGNPTRGNLVPRLVGFLSEVEREFFELICEVDGVGVRKALRAIVRPVGEIATAIEEQDAALLSTLPGIGAATAERMIAKLRRRMPKFALLVAREAPDQAGPGPTCSPRRARCCGRSATPTPRRGGWSTASATARRSTRTCRRRSRRSTGRCTVPADSRWKKPSSGG
jgi:hypothetical protein